MSWTAFYLFNFVDTEIALSTYTQTSTFITYWKKQYLIERDLASAALFMDLSS